MIKIEDITEEQKDFLYEIIVDTKFEVFLINKHIENVNSEFKDKFGIDLNFSFDDFEDLFNFLELRHCENCGMVESYDNGGGTIDEMDCCGECYNETADRLEEDNEDEED